MFKDKESSELLAIFTSIAKKRQALPTSGTLAHLKHFSSLQAPSHLSSAAGGETNWMTQSTQQTQ
jgi:hypothetical protein